MTTTDTITTPLATYSPLTATETKRWLKGANLGAVVAGAYLRANVDGAESASADTLYLRTASRWGTWPTDVKDDEPTPESAFVDEHIGR